ncbi:hypothetical protein [Chitinophaga caseinilytica]|uniref:Uncharacterized protein n=1 Tax=Chitinophaga caseinilytica TaxID=2267521 RepID=A0ABZ2ZDL7_9BACT
MKSRFEILASLPVYGPMYIPVTESKNGFSSEGFVVRFHRVDGTDWVANFEKGWTRFNLVHEFPGYPNLLVVAGGRCYVMNPESTEPVAIFGIYYEGSLTLSDGRLILYDLTEITLVELNCQFKHSERISWDGIKEVSLKDGLVRGLAYDPIQDADDWKPFTLDISNFEINGGSYLIGREVKKPWWKIW